MKRRSEFFPKQGRERVLAGEIAAETHLEEIPLAQENLLAYARKCGYVVCKFGLGGMACRLFAEYALPNEDYRTLVECGRTGDRIDNAAYRTPDVLRGFAL